MLINGMRSYFIISMNQRLIITVPVTIMLVISVVLATFLNSNSRIVFGQHPFTPGSTEQGNVTVTNNSNSSVTNHSISTMSKLNLINATGNIASLQNNATGKPTWLATGQWNMSMPTTTSSQRNPANPTIPMTFNTSFIMTKLDGTETHKHRISNFKLLSNPINNNLDSPSSVFIGTATITLKDGIHNGVPITIKILHHQSAVISIMPNPTNVDGHFGDTPLYGIVWTICHNRQCQ
jgi:hypothetical protein